jgi:hypothetical protein
LKNEQIVLVLQQRTVHLVVGLVDLDVVVFHVAEVVICPSLPHLIEVELLDLCSGITFVDFT